MDKRTKCAKIVVPILRIQFELLELLIIVGLFLLSRQFRSFWPNGVPVQTGFFCNDFTLQYPKQEDTVPNIWIAFLGFFIPLSWIIKIEMSRYMRFKCQNRNKKRNSNIDAAKPAKSDWSAELKLLREIYHVTCTLSLGWIGLSFFVAVGKNTIGRLRPHFLGTCQPQLADGTTCADVINHGIFITNYTCLGLDEEDISDAYQSFPSAHAAFAFYGMVFLALYLQRSFHGRISWVLKPVFQLFLLLIASFVALSRIMDYMHHWSDVLFGSIAGTLIAIFVFFCRNWKSIGKVQYGTIEQNDVERSSAAPNQLTLSSEVMNEAPTEVISETPTVVTK